ncbi:MAG: M18 family aminopeptidase [Polyangiales bacterium]
MPDHVQSLLDYIDASPTPFHAVAESVRRLRAAGFSELSETDAWTLKPGGRYFTTRGGSSIVAFTCGQKAPEQSGFLGIGAHTDSPNLRIKPSPEVRRHGYRQLGVEVYGAVLLSTWLDRDLTIAGRVSVEKNGQVEAELIDFVRPLVRIPNLAIHLNRTVNSEGLLLNAQQHLAPILGLEMGGGQESLLELLTAELKRTGRQVEANQILCWDLCLYDSQRATLAGLESEFIQSGRLDNLAGCFAALTALETARGDHDATRVIVLYDHEEVGSRSAQGAYSSLLRFALQRITEAFQQGQRQSTLEAFARAMARSFLISADMAHAIHPNYPERHESHHQPVLGRGPVLKMNVNQSYATDGMTAARLEQWCRKAEVKLQPYVARSDMACGSTVGPITAAELGLATVDLGNPLLSMHSVREMCACSDVNALARLLDTYFA